MVVGRKPKPPALKILEGNPGKRRIETDIPQPDDRIPTCPHWLEEAAKVEWMRVAPELNRLGLLTRVDRAALAAYCQSYARWQAAETILSSEGITCEYTNKNGSTNTTLRPEVLVAKQYLQFLRAFCSEFGLTPSSRARMVLPKDEEDDEENDFRRLLGGKLATS
jgi:P27 family predicted phage terminase small subunit